MPDIIDGLCRGHIKPLNTILVEVHHRARSGIRGPGKIYDHVPPLGPLNLKAQLGVIIELDNHRDKAFGGLFAAFHAVGYTLNKRISRNGHE